MLYVGDGDAESSADGEGTTPFGGVGAGSAEANGGVLMGADESFPSALDGTAASMICWNSDDCAGNENTATFSGVGGKSPSVSW